MKLAQLFRNYELLVDKADAAFHKMEREQGSCIKCERQCSDCCHAIFGLFLIEVAYLKQQFDQLGKEEIKAALLRCNQAEGDLKRLDRMLQAHEGDPNMQAYTLARERVRCPLLDEKDDCTLYPYRPITCRVYGIPTRIHGKVRVCGKADFKAGENYPVFDLDGIYRDLYILSRELLNGWEKSDSHKASLLISVPKAISTPQDDLLHEVFEQSSLV